MTPARFNILQSSASAIAQKVLAATPITEAWTMQQVYAELNRQGCAKDRHIVAGCLASLVGMGLVVEPAKGKFQRAKVRDKTPADCEPASEQPQEPEEVKPNPAAPAAQKKPSQMDRLAVISERFRKIGTQVMQLADEIDAAALATEEEIMAIGEDTKKLKQLQELLRGIGT